MLEATAVIVDQVQRWRGEGALVVGLCGAQGCGKSTITAEVARGLGASGLGCAVLALDDLYLAKGERRRLAQNVHPLLATRGPPGTHDVAMGEDILGGLRAGRTVRVPRFDKLSDDRDPKGAWASGAFDVILFEGWCVGAAPEPDAMLVDPVNALERDEDPHGVWRSYVNAALAGSYRPLFAQIDRLVMLQAPDFDVVQRWRAEQEAANASAADPARRALAMDAMQVARFIQHFERLTRWMMTDLPGRADLTIVLDAERGLVGAHPARAPAR